MNFKELIKNIKPAPLFFSLVLPLTVGCFSSLLVSRFGSFRPYRFYPSLNPSPWVFIVVWTLLYILMGVSFYINNFVVSKEAENNAVLVKLANNTYFYSLILNALYSIIFFIFKMPFIGSLICLYLLLLVLQTISNYRSLNRLSALLQIPYALWLIFAGYLSLSVWWLNW